MNVLKPLQPRNAGTDFRLVGVGKFQIALTLTEFGAQRWEYCDKSILSQYSDWFATKITFIRCLCGYRKFASFRLSYTSRRSSKWRWKIWTIYQNVINIAVKQRQFRPPRERSSNFYMAELLMKPVKFRISIPGRNVVQSSLASSTPTDLLESTPQVNSQDWRSSLTKDHEQIMGIWGGMIRLGHWVQISDSSPRLHHETILFKCYENRRGPVWGSKLH